MPNKLEEKLEWLIVLFPGFLSLGIAIYIVGDGTIGEFQLIFLSFGFTLVNLSIALGLRSLWNSLPERTREPNADDGGRTGPETSPDGVSAAHTQPNPATKGAEESSSSASPSADAQSEKVAQERWRSSIWPFYILTLAVSIGTGIVGAIAYEKDWFLEGVRALSFEKRSSHRPLAFLCSQINERKLDEDAGGDARSKGRTKTAILEVELKSGEIYEGWCEGWSIEPDQLWLSPACKGRTNGAAAAVQVRGPGVLIAESEIKTVTLLDPDKSECAKGWFRISPTTSGENVENGSKE